MTLFKTCFPRTDSFLLARTVSFQAWIITCIFFVFGALLEYSIILLRIKIYRDESRLENLGGKRMQTYDLLRSSS